MRTRHRILGARMIRRRHDDQQPDEERPSKGARKRASQDLQELGEQLIDLPDPLFQSLPLPESLPTLSQILPPEPPPLES